MRRILPFAISVLLLVSSSHCPAFPGMGGGGMPAMSPPDSSAAVALSAPGRGDTTRVAYLIERLCSPDFAGRRCGGDEAAAVRDYLSGQLLRAGVAPLPGRDGYEHRFGVSGCELSALTAELAGPDARALTVQLSLGAPPEPAAVSSLRFWDEGEPAPAVDGSTLLVHFGPGAGHGTFLPTELLREARGAGAAGLLIVPNPADTRGLYGRYLMRASMRDRRLHGLSGTSAHDPNGRAGILGYIRPDEAALLTTSQDDAFAPDALLRSGWSLTLPDTRTFELKGCNLVGRLQNTPAENATRVLIIAHYDHLGRTESGFYPGANDNASGVAALLETAHMLLDEHPGAEVRFLVADAEELGFIGASAYLRDFGAPDLVINIDSIGRAAVADFRLMRDPANYREDTLVLWQARGDDALTASLQARMAEAGFTPTRGDGPMLARGGDHAAFAGTDVPALFVFGGFEMGVNSEEDSPEGIAPARCVLVAEGLVDFIVKDLSPPAGD